MPAYGELADVYDLLHRNKPYAREARAVRALAQRYARRPLQSLLDVACGSGRHLEAFARWFDCAGVDASRQMLSRARRRAPGARLTWGRMESFRLGRRFDVVTCLFSTVGYAGSVATLRRVVANLGRHTTPGGVVVVEPWLSPSNYRPGLVHADVAEHGGLTVTRMTESVRRGGRSVFTFHHLVGRSGRVRYVVERHDLGLYDLPTMLAALRDAGLRPIYLARGLSTHRGLYVALRPPEPTARRRDGPTPGRSRRPSGSRTSRRDANRRSAAWSSNARTGRAPR